MTVELLKLALEYLKVLAWPLLIVGLLAVYRPPIKRLVKSLATKLEAADSLSIGSFSLEVQRRASDLGSPALARQIGQLSFDAVEALIRTPRSGSMCLVNVNDFGTPHEYGVPLGPELNGLRELVRRKLIVFSEPLEEFLSLLSSTGERREPNPSSESDDRTWYAAESDELDKRCSAISYSLTESGVMAVDAISKAVAAQLAGAKA
ncbi:MAG: hypothetical protein WBP85_07830 [Terracidiphilus sp.]